MAVLSHGATLPETGFEKCGCDLSFYFFKRISEDYCYKLFFKNDLHEEHTSNCHTECIDPPTPTTLTARYSKFTICHA